MIRYCGAKPRDAERRGRALRRALDTMLDPSHTRAKIRILVHEDSTRYGLALLAKAQTIVAETFPEGYRVRYTGTIASTAAATEVNGARQDPEHLADRRHHDRDLGCCCSLVGGLLVAVPLALAVAVNFGVMGLLGIPLDTMTSAISAMAVGIGADYAMYFLFRTREELTTEADLQTALERSLATSGKAVLFVSSAHSATRRSVSPASPSTCSSDRWSRSRCWCRRAAL